MTGKEERTKTEMKNADKQGMVRDGVSGHPGHIRHQNTQRLTSQTLAAVNTDNTNTFLMMRLSEEDQVQTTTMKISQTSSDRTPISYSYICSC